MQQHDQTGRDTEEQQDTRRGGGSFANEREQLIPLSSLQSWTVSDGEPDIRGWEVRTVSGRHLGQVSDLLIDEGRGEIVQLDVALSAANRHTFVPIHVVEIERSRHVVLMDSADLPDAGFVHDKPVRAGRRTGDAGTVSYPQSDREVTRARPSLASDVARAADDGGIERRRGERRRIERVSTDL